MPWFRLEDSFYANPKVVAAGNNAVGLWVRCATWSAAHLTDGRIPTDVVRGFGTRRESEALTRVRLWVPVDDEYVIADWLEYQPSALEVKERRKRDAERKQKAREFAAGKAIRDGRVVNSPITGRFQATPGQEPFP